MRPERDSTFSMVQGVMPPSFPAGIVFESLSSVGDVGLARVFSSIFCSFLARFATCCLPFYRISILGRILPLF